MSENWKNAPVHKSASGTSAIERSTSARNRRWRTRPARLCQIGLAQNWPEARNRKLLHCKERRLCLMTNCLRSRRSLVRVQPGAPKLLQTRHLIEKNNNCEYFAVSKRSSRRPSVAAFHQESLASI